MAKKLLFAIVSFLILVSSLSLSSAYPYYAYPYDDGYNSYSYQSRYVSGYNGNIQTTTTYFDRTSANYWDGRDYVKRTTYSYTTRESPNYYGYSNYYGDYPPWYTKYYRVPSYPRYYYQFSYYPNYGYGYYNNYYDP